MIDPFRLCLAVGPVAIYLLLLGAINLSRRPLLVSGTRDAAALALAVSGLVIVGPLELFCPEAAAMLFGPYVWVFLLSLHGLCAVLLLLMLRPRLVVYNISADELRPILADLVTELDAHARWAGDSLVLPQLGVQLHIDGMAAMRNVSLVASGPHQDYLGWRQLETALGAVLGEFEVARNPHGAAFLAAGLMIVVVLTVAVAGDPQAVLQGLFDMLRLEP